MKRLFPDASENLVVYFQVMIVIHRTRWYRHMSVSFDGHSTL